MKMIENIQLETNFWLYEFLHSDIAERFPDIKKKQFNPPKSVLEELKLTAQMMQRIRDLCTRHIDNKIVIHITSGYRCPDLNKIISKSKTSDHMFGRAADFVMYKDGQVIKDCDKIKYLYQLIMTHISYYQLIKEYGTRSVPAWTHISQRVNKNQNIKQNLEIGQHTKNNYVILDMNKWKC
ncbi:MAG: hypothetical protein KatS3mg096_612 [Candidatus Parcubacteria bacterium]|nr:MAG: hypothetical protein KatS3mg096_612 [Candidatus Parcubacteria bacterium]